MTPETNRIEYKQQLTDDLEKEAIAFLNYQEGGVIYIGIDKTGKAIGVSDTDGDMLKIKDRLKNNIMPSCMGLFDVATENIDSKDIIKITFASGTEKPYYIKKLGMSEKGTLSHSCFDLQILLNHLSDVDNLAFHLNYLPLHILLLVSSCYHL